MDNAIKNLPISKHSWNTLQRIHLKEQPYECPICHEKFWNLTAFTRHKNSKHPGEVFAQKKTGMNNFTHILIVHSI